MTCFSVAFNLDFLIWPLCSFQLIAAGVCWTKNGTRIRYWCVLFLAMDPYSTTPSWGASHQQVGVWQGFHIYSKLSFYLANLANRMIRTCIRAACILGQTRLFVFSKGWLSYQPWPAQKEGTFALHVICTLHFLSPSCALQALMHLNSSPFYRSLLSETCMTAPWENLDALKSPLK